MFTAKKIPKHVVTFSRGRLGIVIENNEVHGKHAKQRTYS